MTTQLQLIIYFYCYYCYYYLLKYHLKAFTNWISNGVLTDKLLSIPLNTVQQNQHWVFKLSPLAAQQVIISALQYRQEKPAARFDVLVT